MAELQERDAAIICLWRARMDTQAISEIMDTPEHIVARVISNERNARKNNGKD